MPLSPKAKPFEPTFVPDLPSGMAIFNAGALGSILLESDGMHTWGGFDIRSVADEDLFNPSVFPVSLEDSLELQAVEDFNLELAALEEMEDGEEKAMRRAALIERLQAKIQMRALQREATRGSALLLTERGGGFAGTDRASRNQMRNEWAATKRCKNDWSANPKIGRMKQPRAISGY